MRKFDLVAVAAAACAAFAFAGPASALTAKKMTYEQAYAACKKQIDADQLARQQAERHNVGAGCMKKYGFRLKKKAKI